MDSTRKDFDRFIISCKNEVIEKRVRNRMKLTSGAEDSYEFFFEATTAKVASHQNLATITHNKSAEDMEMP